MARHNSRSQGKEPAAEEAELIALCSRLLGYVEHYRRMFAAAPFLAPWKQETRRIGSRRRFPLLRAAWLRQDNPLASARRLYPGGGLPTRRHTQGAPRRRDVARPVRRRPSAVVSYDFGGSLSLMTGVFAALHAQIDLLRPPYYDPGEESGGSRRCGDYPSHASRRHEDQRERDTPNDLRDLEEDLHDLATDYEARPGSPRLTGPPVAAGPDDSPRSVSGSRKEAWACPGGWTSGSRDRGPSPPAIPKARGARSSRQGRQGGCRENAPVDRADRRLRQSPRPLSESGGRPVRFFLGSRTVVLVGAEPPPSSGDCEGCSTTRFGPEWRPIRRAAVVGARSPGGTGGGGHQEQVLSRFHPAGAVGTGKVSRAAWLSPPTASPRNRSGRSFERVSLRSSLPAFHKTLRDLFDLFNRPEHHSLPKEQLAGSLAVLPCSSADLPRFVPLAPRAGGSCRRRGQEGEPEAQIDSPRLVAVLRLIEEAFLADQVTPVRDQITRTIHWRSPD